jgi:hypothetical protein
MCHTNKRYKEQKKLNLGYMGTICSSLPMFYKLKLLSRYFSSQKMHLTKYQYFAEVPSYFCKTRTGIFLKVQKNI